MTNNIRSRRAIRARIWLPTIVVAAALAAGLGALFVQQQLDFVDAASRGNVAAVRSFLNRGMNPNTSCILGGSTPLGSAAARGRADVLLLLLDRGAAPTEALWPAIANHRPEVVQVLIAYGANVNVAGYEYDIHGRRVEFLPLDVAIKHEDGESARVLRAAGGRTLNPNAESYGGP